VLPSAAEQGVVMADHAGFYETSLLLAARPDLVDMDRLGMGAPWYCNTPDGKAREASVEAGERMWAAMVDAWVEKLSALQRPKRPRPDDVTVRGIF
jgi:creatinine amidohydrolase/Fe(II)-dependent formamide hydrolase-like protein